MPQAIKFIEGFGTDDMVFASTLIWYHAHRQTHIEHTEINRMTHIYKCILTQLVTCTQQLPVLHLMNNLLIQKFTLQRSKMKMSFLTFQKLRIFASHIFAD